VAASRCAASAARPHASLTGGFGGWSQIARRRRKALTQWDGGTPFELTFSLIFDGLATSTSVEADCGKLEQLSRQPAGGGDPPIVRVAGAVPHSDIDWVVSDLAWDPAPIYALSGNRLRHEVTVKLLEHVPATLVAGAASTAAATATGGSSIYVVKQGDTLVSIAAKLPKARHITW